ncbi:hypothetical protein C2G38_2032958 [Gigaspora rosea]|uniref:Uncharacterized protein n=1 Tax=Gigaspora rosea TaxID=44941 RepID=A0A397VN09_9GLOM|nr:hypothetical protein C2G38_2046651 [Gigaspora rosea]RIB23191.1 hypothetical protein C2G38_2032958 [Gigaspora rosea]
MSKRKIEEISEDQKKIKIFDDKEIDYYTGLKNWRLSNEVETQALERAFPNREKRLKFLKLFLEFSEAKVKEYKFIDKLMLKSREHRRFVDAKQFKNTVLNGPYKGAKIEVNRISNLISNLEDVINKEIET